MDILNQMEDRTLDAGDNVGESGTHSIITWLQNRRLMWIPVLAVVLVIALILGLTFAFNSSNDEEPTDDVSRSESPVPQPSEEPDETLDSDGDGIPDVVETEGGRYQAERPTARIRTMPTPIQTA